MVGISAIILAHNSPPAICSIYSKGTIHMDFLSPPEMLPCTVTASWHVAPTLGTKSIILANVSLPLT